MFSITRYQGENESTPDTRSIEKKKARLDGLLEKVNRKRKPVQDTSSGSEQSTLVARPHSKKSKAVKATTKKTTEEREEREKREEEDPTDESRVETTTAAEDVVAEEEDPSEVPALEAFPDLTTTTTHSKDDLQVLGNMGIPDWLLQPTVVSPHTSCPLDKAGLSSSIVQRCHDLGLSSLFAVQMAVIPVFLARHSLYDTRRPPGDLCISAPTGSGKTLAYVLPIVDILSKRTITRLRALVVLPTRDLVMQVKETFDAFTKGTSLKVATVVGQQSFAHEQQSLVGKATEMYPGGVSRVDIVIATPGRLMDHLKGTPNFSLQHLRFLVMDEADRLLSQSYQGWLAHTVQATHPSDTVPSVAMEKKTTAYGIPEADAVAPHCIRSHYALPCTDIDLTKAPSIQKLLFSATLTKDPSKIAALHLMDPEYISVQNTQESVRYTTPVGLKEQMVVCTGEQKPLVMIHLLHVMKITAGLCFTKSIESTLKLRLLLEAYEAGQTTPLRVADYSSDFNVAQRKSTMKKFRAGEIDLLICSDLIGRGIDLDSVDTVISYDVPLFMDKYIHRVGRTARAGREGQAFTLVEKQEVRHFKEMLRDAGHLAHVHPLKVENEQLLPFVAEYKKALAQLAANPLS